MSQHALILRDLRRGKKITPMDALNSYNCFRLGARIYDMRRQGIPVKSERVTDRKTGKTYARYWL